MRRSRKVLKKEEKNGKENDFLIWFYNGKYERK